MGNIKNERVKLEQERREKQRKSKFEDLFTIKWVYLLAAIALGSYLAFQSVRSINITLQKLEIFDLAKEEVQELRVKNIELLLLSERVVSEKYIESAARDKLNYAKEGETLFIIPEELFEDEDLTEHVNYFDPNRVEEVEDEDNFQIWIDFFRFGV